MANQCEKGGREKGLWCPRHMAAPSIYSISCTCHYRIESSPLVCTLLISLIIIVPLLCYLILVSPITIFFNHRVKLRFLILRLSTSLIIVSSLTYFIFQFSDCNWYFRSQFSNRIKCLHFRIESISLTIVSFLVLVSSFYYFQFELSNKIKFAKYVPKFNRFSFP